MAGDFRYLPRLAATLLKRALDASPVVVLMGARQTGKSTLVQSEAFLGERLYLTLDDLATQERARAAPDDLVASAPRLIIDEVQREPDLLLAVKRAVDRDRPRRNGRFVLTGSANLLLMQRVSESLAGRATYVPLWPLTRRERNGLGTAGIWSQLLSASTEDWFDLVRSQPDDVVDWRLEARRSGYPTPGLELAGDDAGSLWFDGYVRTYLERDLRDLAAISDLLGFRRAMQAAVLRLGGLLNQTEMGRDTQIPRATMQRYLGLLETSFQAVRLAPYSVNRTKRLVKSPKLYWSDTAFALAVGGASPVGAHLENLVLTDLVAWRDAQVPAPNIHFWRTADGQEVDFVIEAGERLLPVEVKVAATPRDADTASLRLFRREYAERFVGGLVLHGGTDTLWMSERILAAPWWRVV